MNNLQKVDQYVRTSKKSLLEKEPKVQATQPKVRYGDKEPLINFLIKTAKYRIPPKLGPFLKDIENQGGSIGAIRQSDDSQF